MIENRKFKEIVSDICFGIFYIGLFILELLPCVAFLFLELSDPWLWISCIVSLVAMIVQSIFFECHNMRFYRAIIIAAIIGTAIL